MRKCFTYPTLLFLFTLIELLYFRLAFRFKIIDKSNERSSHLKPTVRGAGIIFPITILIWCIVQRTMPLLALATLFLAVVSFRDDIRTVSYLFRLFIHFIAVGLLFYQLSLPAIWSFALLIPLLIITVGILSVFNFMDGINGITGTYALVSIISLFYVNQYIKYTDESLLLILAMAVLVFLFFNFRTKALCFAGDVGAIVIGFILCFFLWELISVTHNFRWIVFFLVYGLDSVISITFRLMRKENIFQPHRTHLYQYLCNEMGWPHLTVALLYALTQLAVNFIYIFFINENDIAFIALFATATIVYLWSRIYVLKKIKQSS